MRRFTIISGLALMLAILAFVSPAGATVGDSAVGSGTFPAAVGFGSFTVSATGGDANSATGTMSVTISTTTDTAAVRCLLVEGNEAVVVGEVTASTVPSHIGLFLYLHVVDRGTPGVGVDGVAPNLGGSPPATVTLCETARSFFGGVTPLATGEILVVAASAEQKLDELIRQLQSSPVGPGGSYLAKLQSIAGSVGSGNTQAACNQLSAFKNEVEAQTGKKLTQSEADELLAATASIKTRLGCS